jgi:adenylylsulfate kinase
MSKSTSTNVSWHDGDVTLQRREARLRQRGCTLWFTGLSGSGKSTVAVAVERSLFQRGFLPTRLDGDNVRHGLNGDLGFSEEDRTENIRRAGEACILLADVGLVVLASFVSPYERDRHAVRTLHEARSIPFFEVFVSCELAVAEERDPKGLYKKARAGEIKGFTGIDQPYETPTAPDIVVRTDQADVEACAAAVLAVLEREHLIDS